ncbi:MAG: hypothetical protein NVS2B8_20940 [Vulcanimicrobiaceae bacterium]
MIRRHRERGQAVVEFAFSASLFLLLFFAIIDFSRALFTYDRLAQAARASTRYAIVNTAPPPSDCTSASGTCQKRITDYLATKSGLDATILTSTITFGGTPLDSKNPACTTSPSPGCWVNVRLSYVFAPSSIQFIKPTLVSSSQSVIATQY